MLIRRGITIGGTSTRELTYGTVRHILSKVPDTYRVAMSRDLLAYREDSDTLISMSIPFTFLSADEFDEMKKIIRRLARGLDFGYEWYGWENA